jgi:uncharacterized protein (TIGR00251 family)
MASVILPIRVIPRASKAGPAGLRNGHYLIRLHAAPVDGAANAELIDVLSSALDIPKRNISIVSGDRSRSKRVEVIGMDADAARERLS